MILYSSRHIYSLLLFYWLYPIFCGCSFWASRNWRTNVFLHTLKALSNVTQYTHNHHNIPLYYLWGGSDQIIMANPIFYECKSLPTHHKCKVFGSWVCPQCRSDRVFDDLNNVQCKDCNLKPVQNPICPEFLQLSMNHACRLCVILLC